jgi:hypothetical protein
VILLQVARIFDCPAWAWERSPNGGRQSSFPHEFSLPLCAGPGVLVPVSLIQTSVPRAANAEIAAIRVKAEKGDAFAQ